MDFLSVYYGSPRKSHKKKSSKKYTIIGGKAYPIGSMSSKPKRRISSPRSYDYNIVEMDRQFARNLSAGVEGVKDAYRGGKTLYRAGKSGIQKIKKSRFTKEGQRRRRKVGTFMDNIRTKQKDTGKGMDYYQ